MARVDPCGAGRIRRLTRACHRPRRWSAHDWTEPAFKAGTRRRSCLGCERAWSPRWRGGRGRAGHGPGRTVGCAAGHGQSPSCGQVPEHVGAGSATAGSSLFAIRALSASDIWVVGHSQNGNGTITTLTEKFNGSKWLVVGSPNPGLLGVDSLFGIAGAGGGQLFAVGSDEQSGQCCIRTLALQNAAG